MKIPVTQETVKNFLDAAGPNFHKYGKFKHTKEKVTDFF